MEPLAYRKELKAPGPIQKIDFSNPALAPLVRMTAANLQKEARAWHPPAGLKLTYREIQLPGSNAIPCFVLEPADKALRPGLLYLHGGGFFLPLQVSSLQLAAQYAQALEVRVFLPEYHLLPAYPAPAAFTDCCHVYSALRDHGEGFHLDQKLLLYGESAGGTLAAGLAAWARDHACPADGQALIYPVLDDLRGQYPSRRRYANAVWTQKSNEAMWRSYLRQTPQPDGYLVPMHLYSYARLPAAYIEPQQMDALHDEAIAYAARLASAGVPVECYDVSGSYHGFDADAGNPFVQQVIRRRVAALDRMLHASQQQGV